MIDRHQETLFLEKDPQEAINQFEELVRFHFSRSAVTDSSLNERLQEKKNESPANPENIRIAEEFTSTWENVDPRRIAAEIKSLFNETHRLPDDFYIIIENSEAVDPETQKTINFERNTKLEKQEGKVFDDLVEWASKNEEGITCWFSPSKEKIDKHFNGYPCNKVCFYEIAYTFEFPPKKVLLGTTILFDSSQKNCLDIAKLVNSSLTGETNPEILRDRLLPVSEDFDLLKILELISAPRNSEKLTLSQETIAYFVDAIKAGCDPGEVVQEMHQRGIIGKHSISCPRGSMLTKHTKIYNFSKNKEEYEEIIECVFCPFCETTVRAGVKGGRIYCLECEQSAPYQKVKN